MLWPGYPNDAAHRAQETTFWELTCVASLDGARQEQQGTDLDYQTLDLHHDRAETGVRAVRWSWL